jgi:hypothetical protein
MRGDRLRLSSSPSEMGVADGGALFVLGEEGGLVDAGPEGFAFGGERFDGVEVGGLPLALLLDLVAQHPEKSDDTLSFVENDVGRHRPPDILELIVTVTAA